jgi:hypothetical protein
MFKLVTVCTMLFVLAMSVGCGDTTKPSESKPSGGSSKDTGGEKKIENDMKSSGKTNEGK